MAVTVRRGPEQPPLRNTVEQLRHVYLLSDNVTIKVADRHLTLFLQPMKTSDATGSSRARGSPADVKVRPVSEQIIFPLRNKSLTRFF